MPLHKTHCGHVLLRGEPISVDASAQDALWPICCSEVRLSLWMPLHTMHCGHVLLRGETISVDVTFCGKVPLCDSGTENL